MLIPTKVAAFARDVETSRQVWSREIGYPGDFEYRVFYRDLGYDAFYDYIQPYLHKDGVRRGIGIKYHRITGVGVDLAGKEPYRPQLARQRVIEHTRHFIEHRCKQLEEAAPLMDIPPVIVAPYDAELFGHWWFEGPIFIEQIFREMVESPERIQPVTPSEYLSRRHRLQMIQPATSTWGHQGHFDVWLNETTDWIYRHLHHCEQRMVELVKEYPQTVGIKRRVLNQMARELLLAQSSDWAFIMTSNTAMSYARRRTREHIHRFLQLDEQMQNFCIDENQLKELEWKDNLFSEIDYRAYR